MPNFYGSQPYSAPKPRSLPTYTEDMQQESLMANWQTQVNQSIQNAAPQATPFNFAVTNGTNQLTLSWGAVSGSDGYEILKSPSGSFNTDLQIIPVKNANQTSYVDNTIAGGAKCFYRIRTTSGTKQNPQSQRGPESGVVSHTAISSSSTQSSTTKLDQFTTDSSRAGARKGNYGAFKQANTGVPSRISGVGHLSGAATGASGPAAGTASSGVKSVAPSPTASSASSGGGPSISSNGTPGGGPGAIQYNASGNFGGSAATVDSSGDIAATTLDATTVTCVGLAAAAAIIVAATITTATVQTLVAPAAIVTVATITTATVQTLVAPAAIVTAATITTATITNCVASAATVVTATVTSTLLAATATVTNALYAGSIVTPSATTKKIFGYAANGDITGTVLGTTTVASKAYAASYVSAPIVVVSPTTVVSTFYVTSTAGGFIVNYGPSESAIFTYFTAGNPN